MLPGELVSSARGAWRLEHLLGRGLWGSSWAVTGQGDEYGGTHGVLKIAHGAEDLAAVDAAALAAASAAATDASRRDLETRRRGSTPAVLAAVSLPDGRPGYVVPRFASTLEARLASGLALSDAVDLIARVLSKLESDGLAHGNLRPTNILLDEQDDVFLVDALPAPILPVRATLERLAARSLITPPEVGSTAGAAAAGWDTWALSLSLWRAAVAPGQIDDATRRVDLPTTGLDRVQLASLKDATVARLRAEHVIPRFATRATTRFGSTLERALSATATPSPPYRFETASELRTRIVEVSELIRPTVGSVSKLQLGANARDSVFEGGESVTFSVNVATSAGVSAEDDVACGLMVRDLDARGDSRVRVPGSRFTVERYPSGRWRFNFELPDVPPGRYTLRVAFSIKDGRAEPVLCDGQFEVRPRPGYVPPPSAKEETKAIPFRPNPPPTAPQGGPVAREEEAAPVDLGSRRTASPRPLAPGDDPYVVPDTSDRFPTDAHEDMPPGAFDIGTRPTTPPRAAVPSAPVPTLRIPTAQASGPVTIPGALVEPITTTSVGGPYPPAIDPTDPFDLAMPSPSAMAGNDAMPFDYPPMAPPGADLPSMDLGSPTSVRDAGAALQRAREVLVDQWQRDPWQLFAVGVFAVVGLIALLSIVTSFL